MSAPDIVPRLSPETERALIALLSGADPDVEDLSADQRVEIPGPVESASEGAP